MSSFFKKLILDGAKGIALLTKGITAFIYKGGWITAPLSRFLLSFILLPLYQVLRRLRRRAYFHPLAFATLVIGRPLILILLTGLIMVGVFLNIYNVRHANAQTLGEQNLLFQLAAAPDITTEEMSYDHAFKKTSPYYWGSDRATQWQLAVPTRRANSEQGDLALLQGGTTLVGTAISGETSPEAERRSTPITYTIVSGDTLLGIAERFNVSAETILWENNLSLRSVLRPGQTLTILPVSGVAHTIKRGETIGALAQRYDVSVDSILAFNDLPDERALTIGKKIIIPEGRPLAVRQAPRVQSSVPSSISFVPKIERQTGGQTFIWPTTSKRINQYFWARHTGVDIHGTYSSPVLAAADGVIEFSGWSSGYGLNLVVNHGNGTKTRYAHNSKNFVSAGQHVAQGERIGMVGSTGWSTGPHIHFEVIVNGRFQNPLNYIY